MGQLLKICTVHQFFPFLEGGGRIFEIIVFTLNYSTLCTEWCTCTNIGHPACSLKGILNDRFLLIAYCHYWPFIVVSASPKANKFDPIWINLNVAIQCVGKESTKNIKFTNGNWFRGCNNFAGYSMKKNWFVRLNYESMYWCSDCDLTGKNVLRQPR